MKKNYLLYSFIIIVFMLTILSFINKDKEFSELENRKLKTNVIFTFKDFISGTFQENYETYINDQFPMRDNWISLKSRSEYILGKVENNGIIYGSNGELFEKFDTLNEERLKNNIEAINIFSEKYYDKVSLMIIPNSYEIYKESLPLGSPQVMQEKIIDEIYSYLKYTNNINIMKDLLVNKENYIYYKTDHHWTTLGAYLSYCEFVKSIGLMPVDIEQYEDVKLSNFYGSYFSKAKPFNIEGDTLTYYEFDDLTMDIVGDNKYDSLYDYSKASLRDKYSLFLRGNNPITIIKNNKLNNGKKILIIKDSFANSLVPFLTQDYEEVHVVDLRSFSAKLSNYMSEYNFDNILILYNFINLATDNNVIRLKY
ncbi:DHHW family protein [Clostridioides difficile]